MKKYNNALEKKVLTLHNVGSPNPEPSYETPKIMQRVPPDFGNPLPTLVIGVALSVAAVAVICVIAVNI